MTSFSPYAAQFLRLTTEIIWCTVTTVDRAGRPRSRILHPIWQIVDGLPVGWIVTSKTPVKAAHLAANPHVACSYWSPTQNVVLIEAVASWVEDDAGKQHVWELFMTTPPPLGYDLGGYGPQGRHNPLFEPLRLDAWRVQLLDGEDFAKGIYTPHMWHRQAHSAS